MRVGSDSGGFTPRAWAADATVVNLGGPANLAVVQVVLESGWGAYLFAFHEGESLLARPPVLSALGLPSHVMSFRLVDGPLEKRALRCLENGVSGTLATSDDGVNWWAIGLRFHWDPDTATLNPPPAFGGFASIPAAVLLHSPEDDALIQSYADFDC